jgi:hypothetical protein
LFLRGFREVKKTQGQTNSKNESVHFLRNLLDWNNIELISIHIKFFSYLLIFLESKNLEEENSFKSFITHSKENIEAPNWLPS